MSHLWLHVVENLPNILDWTYKVPYSCVQKDLNQDILSEENVLARLWSDYKQCNWNIKFEAQHLVSFTWTPTVYIIKVARGRQSCTHKQFSCFMEEPACTFPTPHHTTFNVYFITLLWKVALRTHHSENTLRTKFPPDLSALLINGNVEDKRLQTGSGDSFPCQLSCSAEALKTPLATSTSITVTQEGLGEDSGSCGAWNGCGMCMKWCFDLCLSSGWKFPW